MQKLKQKTTCSPLDDFGKVEKKDVSTFDPPSISPFDFVNSINYIKNDLMVDEWSEKQYNTYVINKALSFGKDTAIYANEMNARPHVPKRYQYYFLINSISPLKRFNKWIKKSKIDDIEIVREYYGYNHDKARQVLPILSKNQLLEIKKILESKKSNEL